MKRWYLAPFSLLYGTVTSVRNALYAMGIFKEHRFSTPVINVGNLSVGGSGKSPMVMFLAEKLSAKYRTGVLSRGYGRKSSGYQLTNYNSTVQTVGDEAMQLFSRFRNRFVIAVCEDRVHGATKMIKQQELEVLILDDAYQHRAIKPSLNILMTDYNDPYFKDWVLPAGNLRETTGGAARADLIVVSKCPSLLSEEKKKYYIQQIKPQAHQKVYFSSIVYDEQIAGPEGNMPDNNLAYYDILLITGIANPSALLERLTKFSNKVHHLKYPDHYNFTEKDIEKILKKFSTLGDYRMILTTEKDYVRLKHISSLYPHLHYWPINVMIDKEEEFMESIKKSVGQKLQA